MVTIPPPPCLTPLLVSNISENVSPHFTVMFELVYKVNNNRSTVGHTPLSYNIVNKESCLNLSKALLASINNTYTWDLLET